MRSQLPVRRIGLWIIVLSLIVVPFDFVSTYAQDTGSNTVYLPIVKDGAALSDFDALSKDLAQMEDLFSGGNGETVSFDEQMARQKGFREESIVLANELAAYTNDLILSARELQNATGTADLDSLGVSIDSYPSVQAYFALADQNRAEMENDGGDVELAGWCKSWLTDKSCTCGHWGFPRPSRSASWRTWNDSNPAKTLRSWGYHETPGWAGGGWTRAQTYYSSRCGTNTFRDHAYIMPGGRQFREQNYNGFIPRGEPNPEFWNGSNWPYAAWPSYVYWWHQTY